MTFIFAVVHSKKFKELADVEGYYRSGPVNSNTVNSKFHLIQTFLKIFATFLSFQC